MRAGKLRHRVTILRDSFATNDFGEHVVSGTDTIKTVWGEIRPLRGRELEIARQARSETTHRITLRYSEPIFPNDRIGFRGREFSIHEIIDVDERNIEMNLLCSEMKHGET